MYCPVCNGNMYPEGYVVGSVVHVCDTCMAEVQANGDLSIANVEEDISELLVELINKLRKASLGQ